MNLDEWRSNPELSAGLRKIMDDPSMKAALAVCESMSPHRETAALAPAVVASTSQFYLGKIAGFQQWRMALEELCVDPKEHRNAREDYNRPKVE